MSNIHYVAGLFDGEGTVSMAKPSTAEFYVPVLSLSSTDRVLCEVMTTVLGGGNVYEKRQNTRPAHHKRCFEWRWKGAGSLAGMEQLAPHILCPKKRARMAFLLDRYAAVTRRNGKYSAEEAAVKANLHHEFFTV
jgi:hypothetical protein